MSTKNTYRLTLYRYKLLSVLYIDVKIVPVRYITSLIDESETRQEHTIMNKLSNIVQQVLMSSIPEVKGVVAID